jgi:8-hydroxy-5-deazaflavin:NADPH oxidoreductase
VRAFNSIPAANLASDANRTAERVAVPLAADDRDALDVAARLVRDAGFEPVIVGPLTSAKKFDRGTAVYGQALTARELRQRLGLE